MVKQLLRFCVWMTVLLHAVPVQAKHLSSYYDVLDFYLGVDALIVSVDLPAEWELTPTHPQDVDANRPERSQPTPIHTVANVGWHVGVDVRPFREKHWQNLGIGIRQVFPVYGDFRSGFITRKPYQYFIGGEQAYTYTRITKYNLTELRVSYRIFWERYFYDSKEVEFGVKYTFYHVAFAQGWDRNNRDEVYRTAQASTGFILPFARVKWIDKFNHVGWSVGLEPDYAIAKLKGAPGRTKLRGIGITGMFFLRL